MVDLRHTLESQRDSVSKKIAAFDERRKSLETEYRKRLATEVDDPLAELRVELLTYTNMLNVLDGKKPIKSTSNERVSRQSEEQRQIASKIISVTQNMRQAKHALMAGGRGTDTAVVRRKLAAWEAELVPLRARKDELKNAQRREARKR